MEIAALLIFTLMLSVAILALVLGACGIAAAFGKGFKRPLRKASWALLLAPFLVLWGTVVGSRRCQTNEVEISSPALPKSFEGYRIVQISDIHLRSFSHRKALLKRFAAKVNALEPDLVAFTGDIVTFDPSEMKPELMDILLSIKARDGVVSIMGNHDFCSYRSWDSPEEHERAIAQVKQGERKIGWRLLDNENILLRRGPDSLRIAGISNISATDRFESRGDLSKALEGIGEGETTILLSHDPNYWRKEILGKQPILLTLSGHTHNMQITVFGLEPSKRMFPENSGLYCENGQYLYVNVGLGETVIPSRFNAPAEISVLTLK